MSCVTHIESALDGTRFDAGTLQTTHEGRPLVVRYDLERAAQTLTREALAQRPQTLWRWGELLPVTSPENIVSLGETVTPVLAAPRLGAELGLQDLLIKDESRLPTGSFKARGMALAVSMAKELGVTHLAAPSAGNAGGALAAYAARAGMGCTVLMPDDTPEVNVLEAAWHGARVFKVNGLIHECGVIVRQACERFGWFDVSTLKEPYRLEGKKTMGLELAEQLGWQLPDVIVYPTGGGTGLLGMDKAFDELEAMGLLPAGGKRPRFLACQSAGCAPIVRAFDEGKRFATPVVDGRTAASGLRVPAAVGDFMILDAVRRSGGAALAAAENGWRLWMERACALEGLSLCPESAVCLAALQRAVTDGLVQPDERVVLFNTGAAQKYVEVLRQELPRLDKNAVEWDSLDRRREPRA